MERNHTLFGLGGLLSLALHLLVALWLFNLPSAPSVVRSYEVSVPFEAASTEPGGQGDQRLGSQRQGQIAAEPGGHRSTQNVDAADRGQQGDRTGAERAILLMHRTDAVILFDSPLNNLAAGQSQRIRTARDRATLERRRATPNPADDPFLASGHGMHPERRPVRATDATSGARVAPSESVEGVRPSDPRPGQDRAAITARAQGMATPAQGSAASGGEPGSTASPGVGILNGRGQTHRQGASVAHGRPTVDQGPAATEAQSQDPRIRDNRDAELLARQMMHSWVESTPRSGARAGTGRGGVGGGGAPGSGGGRSEGGRASSHGPGSGRYSALDTSDERYRRWFLEQRARVQRALRYPEARALAMDQGTVVYAVVVRRDGSLVGRPRLIRGSGFEDMNQAALTAIRAATPFSPLPEDLAPGQNRLHLRIPVPFSNPMVR